MSNSDYSRIISLVRKAADIAREIGIQNLLQPGLVKEMIIAEILGHKLIHSKKGADACSWENENEQYEYLSCKEGGSGQLDRMFKSPSHKRAESLNRIKRNALVYIAVFYKDNQMKCKVIYEISPRKLLSEAERQLDSSINSISHLSFNESWARKYGKIAYQDKN